MVVNHIRLKKNAYEMFLLNLLFSKAIKTLFRYNFTLKILWKNY